MSSLAHKQGITRALTAVAKAVDNAVISESNPIASFDIETAFQLFCSFSGDVERTAHALAVEPKYVIAIAASEKWAERLAPIFALQQSKRPGDVERGINRALNFAQAHRLRLVVERMIDKLHKLSDEQLMEYCFEVVTKREKDGTETVIKKIVTRPFADLATAMEKCQSMTYQALSDTATDRTKRAENPGEFHSAADLHSALSTAMSEIREKNSPHALLFDAQVKRADSLLTDSVSEK